MGRNNLVYICGLCRYYSKSIVIRPSVPTVSLAKSNFVRYSSSHAENDRKTEKWTIPSGHPTKISVYNILTKTKVPLILRKKSLATWYMCGPTVYDSAHLGHACCYVKFDIIRRILENYFDINVLIGMSVTDIDDKIIKRSRELKEDFKSVSNKYEIEFWEDMRSLNVSPPNVALKVTKHIDEIISFISKLINTGKAYVTNDGSVYFKTSSYPSYGRFVPISKEEIECSQDVKDKPDSRQHKMSIIDFALWKGSVSSDDPGWPSPWGIGRPGWHIECSAMASKLFGSNIDIHSGGIDLKFPHHENEDAQSCSYHEVPQWVNYWIYTGHLYQKGQSKMSKSLKNTLSIQEFLCNYTPNQFRMFCLLSQYRYGVEYTEETMRNAVGVMGKIESFLADANACLYGQKPLAHLNETDLEKAVSRFKEKILISLADDFNTPAAMSALIELITYTNKLFHPTSDMQDMNVSSISRATAPIASVSCLVKKTLENFGLVFKSDELVSSLPSQEKSHVKQPITRIKQIIEDAVEFRSEVRSATIDRLKKKPADTDESKYLKNILNTCDAFRQNLSASGVTVKDHGTTSSWTVLQDEKVKK